MVHQRGEDLLDWIQMHRAGTDLEATGLRDRSTGLGTDLLDGYTLNEYPSHS